MRTLQCFEHAILFTLLHLDGEVQIPINHFVSEAVGHCQPNASMVCRVLHYHMSDFDPPCLFQFFNNPVIVAVNVIAHGGMNQNGTWNLNSRGRTFIKYVN